MTIAVDLGQKQTNNVQCTYYIKYGNLAFFGKDKKNKSLTFLPLICHGHYYDK